MGNIIDAGVLFYRSKKRIRDYGEVFTPEEHVKRMVALIEYDKSFSWSDPNVLFFEPCCGHGNFVTAVFRKRLNALYDSVIICNSKQNALFYSLANSVNSFWALDIDSQNINECRRRVFNVLIEFSKEKLSVSIADLLQLDESFFSHIIAALYWQISVNETLSALGHFNQAKKINIVSDWVDENGTRMLDFKQTWLNLFKRKKEKDIVPRLYSQASKAIQQMINGNEIAIEPFSFLNLENTHMDLDSDGCVMIGKEDYEGQHRA